MIPNMINNKNDIQALQPVYCVPDTQHGSGLMTIDLPAEFGQPLMCLLKVDNP